MDESNVAVQCIGGTENMNILFRLKGKITICLEDLGLYFAQISQNVKQLAEQQQGYYGYLKFLENP